MTVSLFLLIFIVLSFIMIETALYIRRSRRFKSFQNHLIRAKQETREITQLPLNNPYPLIQINKTGHVVFANPAALKTFPQIDIQGINHPILQNSLSCDTCEVLYQDKVYHQTITSTDLSGEEVFIIYCYDITAQKRQEEALKKAYIETEEARVIAEKAKEARGAFLANMSHELRTPMNGIIGLSDILVDMNLEGERRELIEAVNSSAHNLLILLNDILDFSKIESGELRMDMNPFNLNYVINQIEKLQKPVAGEKNLILKSMIADHVPSHIIGDSMRIQQIINNLMSNALKFTDKGSVKLYVDGDIDHNIKKFLMRISVIDTGIGIPKDKHSNIFHKFQQADTSTARKFGGTGLGLAITKNLIEIMNGTIAIESEEGYGTTFIVTIPVEIADGNLCTEKSKGDHLYLPINSGAKILIVDDHPINLLYMRKMLTKLGFKNFDEASSGIQALKRCEQTSYDIVLMDCQMPEMDGFEASCKIREIKTNNTIPVIVAVTADAMKGAEEKCMAAGMDAYISKPVDKDKLRSVLQENLPYIDVQKITELKKNNEASEIFDWDHFNEFTDGDTNIEKEIISVFIDNLSADFDSLQESFQCQDYEEWDSWIHKLYGACSHIGAIALAKLCDEAQTLFPENTDKIAGFHSAIYTQYQEVCSILEKRKTAIE